MTDVIRIERRVRIAGIRLMRPDQMNTLDLALAKALPAALGDVANDDAIRAVIISGEGRSFMAGGVGRGGAWSRLGHVVVPAAELTSAASTLADRIAQGSIGATAAAKRLIGLAGNGSFDDQLNAELDAFASVAGTADFREGITAFFERRPPHFPDQSPG